MRSIWATAALDLSHGCALAGHPGQSIQAKHPLRHDFCGHDLDANLRMVGSMRKRIWLVSVLLAIGVAAWWLPSWLPSSTSARDGAQLASAATDAAQAAAARASADSAQNRRPSNTGIEGAQSAPEAPDAALSKAQEDIAKRERLAQEALASGRTRADARTQRTRELLQPILRAQSFAELNSALENLPLRDREAAKNQFNAIRQWCSAVGSGYFDRSEFVRTSPLRYAAITELRTFCLDAPAQPSPGDSSEPSIFPLGSALLGAVSQQFMGDFSADRSESQRAQLLRTADNIFEVAMALTQYYRSGALRPPESLGCEGGCSGSFWPASMIMACATVGGCQYRSPLVLGFCATGFLSEGCRVGADYASAIRDRYPHAEWRRVEWAIGQISTNLAPSP